MGEQPIEESSQDSKRKVSRRAIMNSAAVMTTSSLIGSSVATAQDGCRINELNGQKLEDALSNAKRTIEYTILKNHAYEEYSLEANDGRAFEIIDGDTEYIGVLFALRARDSSELLYNEYSIVIQLSNKEVIDAALSLERTLEDSVEATIVRPKTTGLESTNLSTSDVGVEHHIRCGTCETVAAAVCTVGCGGGGTAICLLAPGVPTSTCLYLVNTIYNEGPGCDVGARGICESIGFC
jgi:halocin C8-like bacteriocin domain-containing protein